ncbi:MAG: hypothetical protein ACTSRS_05640 [Candidatus Helarchaeota archaeon]
MFCPFLSHLINSSIEFYLPARESPDFRISFYCEFYNNGTFTDTSLNILNTYQSRIFLAVNESQLFPHSLACNITTRLNLANVSVYAWLLLDHSNGYWAADSNAAQMENLTIQFINWAKSNNLTYDGILIDSEPDFQRLRQLESKIRNFDLYGFLLDLRYNAISNQHTSAQALYGSLIDTIHAAGYEAMVVGFPLIIDDLADGDDSLQRIMGVSTFPPISWNFTSYMVYRTTYRETLKFDFGSYMIYCYGTTLRTLFGSSTFISLSRIGDPPYTTLEELEKDAFIVKNLGFNEVIWIEFPKLIQNFGISGLNTFLSSLNQSKPITFNYNPLTVYSRLLFCLVDQIPIL